MFQKKKIVEKIKTQFSCLITFVFRKSCPLWDNVKNTVEPDRPHMTITRRMRIPFWLDI